MVTGSIISGTSQSAFGAEAPPSGDAVVDAAVEPTATDVPFADALVSTDYVAQGPVSEELGDAQQRDAVAVEAPVRLDSRIGRAASGAMEAGIARLDLDSDNVLIAVTWDAGATEPESVWLRFLEDSTWSEWTELEFDAVEAPDDGSQTRGGTEGFSVFNAESVEVVALEADSDITHGLSVVAIEADNEGELTNSLQQDAEDYSDAETADGVDADADGTPATVDDELAESEDNATTDLLVDYEGLTETDAASVPGGFGVDMGTEVPVSAALSSDGTAYSTGFNGLNIKTRKAWSAPSPSGSPVYMTVKGAVIHHTLSSDNYTQDQVAQQIRNIHSYHAYTLGWGDIGYNLVVDKFGGVWEGRAGGLTSGILGAHATGANWDTFGITYLGGYQGGSPSESVRDVFAKTIAWKFRVHGVTNATGSASIKHGDGKWYSTPVISGHRDVGSTTCPGDTFYSQIPSVRTATASYLRVSTFRGTVTRLGGADRYATNRAVNAASTTTGKPVFVVTGADYADALTASPAAALTGGSLFLVSPGGLDRATSTAIQAKKPSAIYIVGGTGAVSEETATALASATGKTPVRVSGSDRYQTSAAILEKFFGQGTYSKVFIATGLNFPDALTAAAAAGVLRVPVLIVNGKTGEVPEKARITLNKGTTGKTFLAVGGTAAVTSEALINVRRAVSGCTTARLSGADRYATNIAVNDYLSKNGGGATKDIWVATGSGFADALSGATSAGTPGKQLVLSPRTCLPAPVVSRWIESSTSGVQSVTLVGSTGALDDSVASLRACG